MIFTNGLSKEIALRKFPFLKVNIKLKVIGLELKLLKV